MEFVILVDGDDRATGESEKLAAHRPPGLLHRAFSVVLFNSHGQVMLQRRSRAKHHFRGLWSNTCCSHPRPGEDVGAAARRRLSAEMGLSADLVAVGTYRYRAVDPESGLVEDEFVHVLVGTSDEEPIPDAAEADAWRWVDVSVLRRAIVDEPRVYTPWLPLALAVAAPAARLGSSERSAG